MNTQTEIDFNKPIVHKENNKESQEYFEHNGKRFSKQCETIYRAFLKGERLTTMSAYLNYKIGDLRRRVKDLKDTYGVDVKSKYIDGRYKEYYL